MSDIVVKKISYEDAKPLLRKAKKESVSDANPKHAFWLGAFDGDVLTGVTCLVFNPKTKAARFKSSFVLPEYRRRGIFTKLWDARMSLAGILGSKTVTAFCTPMSEGQYLKSGFTIKSRVKTTGFAFVKKVLA